MNVETWIITRTHSHRLSLTLVRKRRWTMTESQKRRLRRRLKNVDSVVATLNQSGVEFDALVKNKGERNMRGGRSLGGGSSILLVFDTLNQPSPSFIQDHAMRMPLESEMSPAAKYWVESKRFKGGERRREMQSEKLC